MKATPHVDCVLDTAGGWRCVVSVRDGDREVTRHEVGVKPADLDRLAPGDPDPTRLVTASFAFLLEREPPSSILHSFELTDIGRYFPEFEAEIRRTR